MSPDSRAPGLYDGIPMSEYLRIPGASNGLLRTLRDKSPMHARYKMTHPDEPTEAMRIGGATHTAVLEPDEWERRYVRGVDLDLRTKAGKEAQAELEAGNPHAEILKPEAYDLALTLREVVLAHPRARRLVEGKAERTMIWDDPETGVRCRGRADLWSDVAPVIVDLKTTRDAAREAFQRDIYTFGYYLQAVHYLNAASALGETRDHFVFIAIEKTPPYGVAVYDLDDDALMAGAEELRSLLMRWKQCEESGEWPGYDTRVTPISIPTWALRQVEGRTG